MLTREFLRQTFHYIRGYVAGDLGPHIVMKTADDKFVPWLASQTDLLADDWGIVDEPGARFSPYEAAPEPKCFTQPDPTFKNEVLNDVDA